MVGGVGLEGEALFVVGGYEGLDLGEGDGYVRESAPSELGRCQSVGSK